MEERMLMTAAGAIVRPPVFLAETFQSFAAVDASHDDSPGTAFSGGALRIDYSIGPLVLVNQAASARMLIKNTNGGGQLPPPPPNPLDHVTVEAWQGTTKLADLGTFHDMTLSGGLVNLANMSLPGGVVTIDAKAYFTDGTTAVSAGRAMQIKTGSIVNGTFRAETFDLNTLTGDGIVIHGEGGTDTLDLKLDTSQIVSLNGKALSAFTPTAGGQAIYQGLVVDYLRLKGGREIYFTGIEDLRALTSTLVVSAGTATAYAAKAYKPAIRQIGGGNHVSFETPVDIALAVSANDPNFPDQWNLHVTDVPDAWRFTKGSSKILIVSLDTGVFPAGTTSVGPGISASRLWTYAGDDDNTTSFGHGHEAISIMIGTPNDHAFQTGINWVSDVYVNDVYDDVNIQDAISKSLDFADANGFKVVFQGGIQGDSWVSWPTTGGLFGTQSSLEDLVSSHENTALYAIAAGNGGPGGNLNDPNFMNSVSGMAKFETNHDNVISVGALQHSATGVGPKLLQNASDVFLAGYSNRGSNLTMVAPTDSPAVSFTGEDIFTGTSCANPNMAAMASLVWSANPNLTAPQVRSILESTAMDLGDAGRDNTFGFGLPDVDTAVRRAVALGQDYALATLSTSSPYLVGTIGTTGLATPVAAYATTMVTSAPKPATVPSLSAAPPTAALDSIFAGRTFLADTTSAVCSARLENTPAFDRASTEVFARLARSDVSKKEVTRHDAAITPVNLDAAGDLIRADCLAQ